MLCCFDHLCRSEVVKLGVVVMEGLKNMVVMFGSQLPSANPSFKLR